MQVEFAEVTAAKNYRELVYVGVACPERSRGALVRPLVRDALSGESLADLFLVMVLGNRSGEKLAGPRTRASGATRTNSGAPQFDPEVRPLPRPITHHAPLNLGKQLPQNRIVIAGHDHSVERQAVHEVEERALHVVHAAIAVHVLAINVGDDGENRRELQK